MYLNKKDIINLEVYTQSDQYLGRIVDFEFDPPSQTIVKYYIKSRDIIKELLQKELLVAKDQVISISKEKMIVEDSIIEEKEKKKELAKKAVPVG